VASLSANNGPQISSGRLREICVHPSLQAIAYAEDPAENQFAEEFTFYGGSYIVFPGIAQSGEYILANLSKAIFLGQSKLLSGEYKSRSFELISAALHVMDAVAKKAGIRRGTPPKSDLHEEIVIPSSAILQYLKNAATFSKEEAALLLSSAKLPSNALDRLMFKAGNLNLDEYDVVNGPLLWRPFLDCGDKIVLLTPGMVVSAIRQALVELAIDSNLQANLAKGYNNAVWDDVTQSLSYTKNMLIPRHPSKPLEIPCASDGFFTLDRDKVLYCVALTDPLTRAAQTDPFGLWTDDALEAAISHRITEIEGDVLRANPAPNDLFMVVVLQGIGGAAAFAIESTPAGSHSLAFSAEALRTISLLEGGDPLALFNFARSREKIRERVRITSTNILDEFYLYRKNEYSFYFSDRALPDFILIPPGDSLNLQLEIARQRDFHASKTVEGAAVEVTSLHGTASIPIYSPIADLGERVRLVVEGLPVPIWITGPGNEAEHTAHRDYALFVDAISYWIWQFTPVLAPLLISLETERPLEIRIRLPEEDVWNLLSREASQSGNPPVETKTDVHARLIEVTINAQLFHLLRRSDNTGERELMRSILPGFSPLTEESKRKALAPPAVDMALEKIAPLGLKKMLLFFDLAKNPEMDQRGLPRYRPLEKVWINEELDRIGGYLAKEEGLKVGEIGPHERTSLLNKIALYCFSQMERMVSSLTPGGLLAFLIAHSETVHREQASNRLTIPTRLKCFQSDPQMIEQLGKRIPELAHVGLSSRLIVEYVVAQPPSGLRPISLDLYDELRAWSYHCLNYAMLSDAIHFEIQDYKLSVLPSQRLGIDGSAWESAIDGHMRAFALDQIGAAHKQLKRQGESDASAGQGELLRTQSDSATTAEFGVPLSELLEIMEFAISTSQEYSPGVSSLPKETFITRAAQTIRRSEDSVRSALDLLVLGPRFSFWTPPEGYVKQDLFPWRYNRPLSYMRRPFLVRIVDGETSIMWGARHVRAAQRFLVDQCTSGKLKAKTTEMRSFMNRLRDAQGAEFNKKVSTFFQELGGLSVKSQVKKIDQLKDLQNHLGDIDVLVGDSERHRILVIECKDLSSARTPYEMSNELKELFVGHSGKKSIVEKHHARAEWTQFNLPEVLRFLRLDLNRAWTILPLIVVDQPLVASYLRESPIQVISFEELKRSWPEIRRV
jgi:hypothetical protein